MKQFLMIAVAVVSSYAANAQVTKISVAKPVVLSRVEAQPTKITVNKPMSAEDSQAVEAILKDLNAADYNITVKDNQNKVSSYGALGSAKVVSGNQVLKANRMGGKNAMVHSTLTDFFSKTANHTNQAALAKLQSITNKYQ
jgi:hypothetical protein